MEPQRPDPTRNQQANRTYAEKYAASHRAAGDSFQARLAVEDLILLDGLLRDYCLLDVGCGTGGHLRFLRNHRHVVGLDFSAPVVEAAKELQREFGIDRVEYIVSKFENFQPAPNTFDAVRMRGTFGAYQPWPVSTSAIDSARNMLREGGIAIASYFPPTNFLHKLKSMALPRQTLAITQDDFRSMWRARRFELLLEISIRTAVVTFWRKG